MTGGAGPPASWPRIILVTGTDTGVGKTIVTAALAVVLQRAPGGGIAVDKPTQTGIGPAAGTGEEADVDVVARLSGVRAVGEGIRLHAPMAPVAAARRQHARLPTRGQHLERVAQLARHHDHVLVEGAGGVLVDLVDDGTTLADLGGDLVRSVGAGQVGVVVVCRAGLGTLNHTALTLEALDRRHLPVTGLVIGSWPAEPDEIDLSNRQQLASLHVPLLGAVPAGAGQLPATTFRRSAPGWFTAAPAAGR